MSEFAAAELCAASKGGKHALANISNLSDDLLAIVLEAMNDNTQLRLAAAVCRRWALLMRERMEFWRHVDLELPHKKSRGRDRCVGGPAQLQCMKLAARSCAWWRLCLDHQPFMSPAISAGADPPLLPTRRRNSYTTPCVSVMH